MDEAVEDLEVQLTVTADGCYWEAGYWEELDGQDFFVYRRGWARTVKLAQAAVRASFAGILSETTDQPLVLTD